jgi:hypothetical protein
LEYDKLSLTGNYASYNTNNVVSNTGMVINTTDTLNNFQYLTNATYTDLNIQRQIQASFKTETTGANFADGIFYQTNDTFTSPLDNTKLSMKSSSTAGTITCFNPTTSNSAPLDIQASSLTLNGSPITSPTPDLNAVLFVGNNAFGQSITGLNNVDLASINSTSYPPPTPSWNDTLAISSTANTSISLNNNNISSVNDIQVNTINGLSPTTIGLLWSDFSNTNAYNNLPNQAYALQNTSGSVIQSQQLYDRFQIDNTSVPNQMILNSSSLSFTDNSSSTTTSYGSNDISSQNGTAFTINAGTGISGLQALNLNCSSLVINGTAYSPQTAKLSQLISNTASWSIGSGSFNNVVSGSFSFASAWSGNKDFQLSVCFNNYNSSEATGVMYIEFYDGMFNPSNPTSFNSSTPCINTRGSSFAGVGNYTLFTFTDRIQINNTIASPTFSYVIYLGHSNSSTSWSGDAKYSIILTEM